jgi:hypothetical protein
VNMEGKKHPPCIYRISCRDPEIKACYIGSSTDLARRMQWHRYHAIVVPGTHQRKLYNTIRKHGGWDNWIVHVIEWLPDCKTKEELEDIENYYIHHELDHVLNHLKNAPRNIYVPVDPVDYEEYPLPQVDDMTATRPAKRRRTKYPFPDGTGPRPIRLNRRDITTLFWIRYLSMKLMSGDDASDTETVMKPSELAESHKSYCELNEIEPFANKYAFGMYFTMFLKYRVKQNIGIIKKTQPQLTEEGYPIGMYQFEPRTVSKWLDEQPVLTI